MMYFTCFPRLLLYMYEMLHHISAQFHPCRLKDQQRAVWKLTELSQHSTNSGVGSLRGKFDVAAGPSTPSTVSTQFNCEGTTISGLEFNLLGSGYRVSLVKKRFVSGKSNYIFNE